MVDFEEAVCIRYKYTWDTKEEVANFFKQDKKIIEKILQKYNIKKDKTEIVRKELAEYGLKLEGTFKNTKTELQYTCPKHGLQTTTLRNFRARAVQECVKCGEERINKELRAQSHLGNAALVSKVRENYEKTDYSYAEVGELLGKPKSTIQMIAREHGIKKDKHYLMKQRFEKAGLVFLNKEYEGFRDILHFECKYHGVQQITLKNFRLAEYSCPLCNPKYNTCYNKTLAEREKDTYIVTDAILYIVTLENKNEKYIKIGITKHSIKERFSSGQYREYKINKIKSYRTNLYSAIMIEQTILEESTPSQRYIPKDKIDGYSECFEYTCKYDLIKKADRLIIEYTRYCEEGVKIGDLKEKEKKEDMICREYRDTWISKKKLFEKYSMGARELDTLLKRKGVEKDRYGLMCKDFESAGYKVVSKTYTDSKFTKVQYICPIHGLKELTYSEFKMGTRCSECSMNNIKYSEQKKKVVSTPNAQRTPFKNVAAEYAKMGYTLLSAEEDYRNQSTLLRFVCPKHGEQEAAYERVKMGYGCPECVRDNFEKRKQLKRLESFKEAKKAFEDKGFVVLTKAEEYETGDTKLRIICQKHGEQKQSYNKLKAGYGCRRCGIESRRDPRKLSIDKVRKLFEERGYKLISTEYVNSRSKLEYECPKHGLQEITYSSLYRGQGCKACTVEYTAELQRTSYKDVREVFERKGYKLITTDYKRIGQELEYECPKHGLQKSTYGSMCRPTTTCPKCKEEKQRSE